MTVGAQSDGEARGPERLRRWARFALVVVVLLAVQTHAVFFEAFGVAVNPPSGAEALTPEIAGGVRVTQTFFVSAGDFDGVVLYPRPTGPRPTGDVVFELAVVEGKAAEPVVRAVRPVAEVLRGKRFLLEFPPIAEPAGRMFQVTVSLPRTPDGSGLALRLVEEDRYVHGEARVDGREFWGDLAFETRARKAVLINRLDEAFRAYPPWLRSAWTLGAVVAAFNALLIWAAWFAVGDPRGLPTWEPRARQWRTPGWTVLRAVAILSVTCLLLAVLWRLRGEAVAVDLFDEFPRAEKRTTWPRLHEGFTLHYVTVEARLRRCIQALPPSRITFTVDVPPNAEFAVWVGMRPDVWQGPGDGATFRVGFAAAGAYEEPWRRNFFPLQRPADRTLAPIRLDLSNYAGQRVNVVLNTEPSMNAVGDAALWCEPRIVRR